MYENLVIVFTYFNIFLLFSFNFCTIQFIPALNLLYQNQNLLCHTACEKKQIFNFYKEEYYILLYTMANCEWYGV